MNKRTDEREKDREKWKKKTLIKAKDIRENKTTGKNGHLKRHNRAQQ